MDIKQQVINVLGLLESTCYWLEGHKMESAQDRARFLKDLFKHPEYKKLQESVDFKSYYQDE